MSALNTVNLATSSLINPSTNSLLDQYLQSEINKNNLFLEENSAKMGRLAKFLQNLYEVIKYISFITFLVISTFYMFSKVIIPTIQNLFYSWKVTRSENASIKEISKIQDALKENKSIYTKEINLLTLTNNGHQGSMKLKYQVRYNEETNPDIQIPFCETANKAFQKNKDSKIQALENRSFNTFCFGKPGLGKTNLIESQIPGYYKNCAFFELSPLDLIPSNDSLNNEAVNEIFKKNVDTLKDFFFKLSKESKFPVIISMDEFDKFLNNKISLKISPSSMTYFFNNFIDKIYIDPNGSAGENQIKNTICLIGSNKDLNETLYFQKKEPANVIDISAEELAEPVTALFGNIFMNGIANINPNQVGDIAGTAVNALGNVNGKRKDKNDEIKKHNEAIDTLEAMFKDRMRGNLFEYKPCQEKNLEKIITEIYGNEFYQDNKSELKAAIKGIQDDKKRKILEISERTKNSTDYYELKDLERKKKEIEDSMNSFSYRDIQSIFAFSGIKIKKHEDKKAFISNLRKDPLKLKNIYTENKGNEKILFINEIEKKDDLKLTRGKKAKIYAKNLIFIGIIVPTILSSSLYAFVRFGETSDIKFLQNAYNFLNDKVFESIQKFASSLNEGIFTRLNCALIACGALFSACMIIGAILGTPKAKAEILITKIEKEFANKGDQIEVEYNKNSDQFTVSYTVR